MSNNNNEKQLPVMHLDFSNALPANYTGIIYYAAGNKCWYLNGKLHRENDLPAAEYANGSKFWYLNGKLHRENDLPAVEYADGSKFWWLNGERHRENDLPAIEYANGSKFWYLNGELHRETGPTIEYANGYKAWFLNGKEYSEEVWKKEVSALNKKIKSKWHTKEITKGTLGELSKIQEELDEAHDALAQDQKLMLMFELSDICGACGLVAEKHGFTLDDLVAFSKLRTQVIKQEIEEKNAKKT